MYKYTVFIQLTAVSLAQVCMQQACDPISLNISFQHVSITWFVFLFSQQRSSVLLKH